MSRPAAGGAGPAVRAPRRLRGNDRLDGRRVEVFRLTAPVFRARGYRGATIKELAHAAHLSPAALYHYFPSKLDLATYLLRRDNTPEGATDSRPGPAGHEPPLQHLSRHLDIFIDQMPLYLLAIDLAEEAGLTFDQAARARLFGEGERALVPALVAAAPTMPEAVATETADALMALLVGPSVTGLAGEPVTIRDRQIGILRERLLAHGVDPVHFEAAMQVRELPTGVPALAQAG
jgi:AcrR family transcriptional regulator